MVPSMHTYLTNIHCVFAHTKAYPFIVLCIPKDTNTSWLIRMKDVLESSKTKPQTLDHTSSIIREATTMDFSEHWSKPPEKSSSVV